MNDSVMLLLLLQQKRYYYVFIIPIDILHIVSLNNRKNNSIRFIFGRFFSHLADVTSTDTIYVKKSILKNKGD